MSNHTYRPMPNPDDLVDEPPLLEIIQYLDGHGLKLTDMTCFNCTLWRQCNLAFDVYNTNGDCLLSK